LFLPGGLGSLGIIIEGEFGWCGSGLGGIPGTLKASDVTGSGVIGSFI